jgi:tRNA dimethylallyltransferase
MIIFIVGPTASGKSNLAMEVARNLGGEIICADSQTIRRNLDIGTAKPSKSDQAEIPHYMLDIIDPYDSFSVNEFKNLATKAIKDIQKRNKYPIVVGGTGLYIDSLFFDYKFDEINDNQEYKNELELMSVAELQKIIIDRNYLMPENKNNPRHLIGIILREGRVRSNIKPIKDSFIFGLMPEDEVLKKRISDRIDIMFDEGLIDEAKKIIKIYGQPKHSIDAIGYPIIIDYIEGKISIEDAKKLFKTGDWQYARRQKSWFKRNEHIIWLEPNNRLNVEIIKEVISS